MRLVIIGMCDSKDLHELAINDIDTVVHLAARVHMMQETADDSLTEYRRVNVYNRKFSSKRCCGWRASDDLPELSKSERQIYWLISRLLKKINQIHKILMPKQMGS